MGDMHLTPLPGPTASSSRRGCRVRLQNIGVTSAQARLGQYLEWATNALQHPSWQMSPADLTGPC